MQLIKHRPAAGVLLVAGALTLAGCSGSSSGGGTPTSTDTTTSQAAPPACPLTGQPATRSEDVKRPALAIKIDNVSDALPQAGVNNADVVVEELVEGGLTRLMAIYQCQKAPVVGPIRSARITDADLLALLHGSVLGYSGANPKDMPPIREHSGAALVSYDEHPEYFHLDSSRPAPHDVFAATQTLLRVGRKERPNLTAPPALFHYGPIDATAKRAHSVYLGWPAASAQWTWSGKAWLRDQDGAADRLVDGSQISATNVVVLNVTIQDTGIKDILGNESPLDVTIGTNPAWVLRDGKMIRGSWSRQSISDGISLTDRAGNPIDLAPGRTWIELLPSGTKPQRR
ncbi:MAG TPA: DUF3048 domain-containing protein [Mycobacteriales bacterium]|nr:DUF3048 domain-containing protein [Mycobacteriales bacterium]